MAWDILPTQANLKGDPGRPVVSVFGGAGGLSLGFALAGLKPLISVDNDEDACRTYQRNIGPIKHADITALDPSDLLRDLGLGRGEVFALIGGPPCQGFSSAGAKNPNDPRNALVFQYLRFVEYIMPDWFVFENVEGILTSRQGNSLYDLIKELIKLGYVIRVDKVNCAAYGVPQSRKRVFITGSRVVDRFTFPTPTHSFQSGRDYHRGPSQEAPCVLDALSDLPSPSAKNERIKYTTVPKTEIQRWLRADADSVSLHYVRRLSEVNRRRIAALQQGQTMKDLPEDLWHPSYRRRAHRRVMDGTPSERRGGAPAGMRRLVGSEPSKTITAQAPSEFVHPVENRMLTLRECARLQSFPDWFEFDGTASSIARQIGNAVPPMMAFVLARHILQISEMDGNRRRSDSAGGLLEFRIVNGNGVSPALASTIKKLESLLTKPQQLSFNIGGG